MVVNLRRMHLGLSAAALLLIACLLVLGTRAVKRHGGIGPAPNFTLPDSTGRLVRLSDMAGKIVILAFVNRNCPDSRAYIDQIESLQRNSAGRVSVFCVDTGNPCDPLKAHLHWAAAGLDVPLLIDPDGAVALAFGVRQTPMVCVIDGAGQVRYSGPFDGNRDASMVRVNYCSDRVNELLAHAR